MRILLYPLILFLFNYILFESFPYGENGAALGALLTIPVIIFAILLCVCIHFYLRKKKMPIRYFQITSIAILIVLSYLLFISGSGNSPAKIISRMSRTSKRYSEITANDYLVDPYFYNYELIVAAKKKFYKKIPDTIYSIKIRRVHQDEAVKVYSLYYLNGRPFSENKKLDIKQVAVDTFRFQEIMGLDTIVFFGNSRFISQPTNLTDPYLKSGRAYPENTAIKSASATEIIKDKTPDTEFFAYRIFYLLL